MVMCAGLLSANTFDMEKSTNSTVAITTVTQEHIDAWMDQFGENKVHSFEVPEDGSYENYLEGYIREPADGVLNNYLRKSDRDPIGAGKVLINTIWLGGDTRIKDSLEYRMAFMGQLTEVLVGGQGRIVERSTTNKKHGDQILHIVEVPVDETYEEYIRATVKHPQPGLLNEYLRKADRVPLDAARQLLNTIWLEGDDRIKTERKYLMSFMDSLSELLVGGQGRVKKLSRSQVSSQK